MVVVVALGLALVDRRDLKIRRAFRSKRLSYQL
jgi:hypothetical protein